MPTKSNLICMINVKRNRQIQGVPFTIYPKEMAVALKWCIFDPMLVKPKCVWEVADFLKNCKQTAEKCKQIFENWKNLPHLKHILALPTWGQICTISELQPLISNFFQMVPPVTQRRSPSWQIFNNSQKLG